MKEAGFKIIEDDKRFGFQFWGNDNGLKIALERNGRISLKDLIKYVTNQAADRTRRRIKEKVSDIDIGEDGFVKQDA